MRIEDRPPGKALGRVRGLAGPLLIVVCPAIVLHDFWLSGRLTIQHPDLLSFWLPRWCHLGNSLSSGHVPTWLPHQFGGVPFVSDPQSGWLSAPVMLLFSVLSCARALDVMIVLNPILAGLGLYVFFRQEGAGRPAATVGGLTISLTMASSAVSLSMPFAGTLAWTSVSLAGAAGYLHSRTIPGALAWLGFTALAFSQVAAAQLTDGLLIATITLIPYLLARSWLQVKEGDVRLPLAAVRIVGLGLAVPLLAGAVLVPRLDLLPRTSIGNGYVELGRLASRLSGTPFTPPLTTRGVSVWWGTSFARGPAGYVGVLAILLIPAALSARRWRLPAAGFALAGAIGWFLNLDWLITRPGVRSFVLRYGLGELWLRSPDRFKYLLALAFAALAGYGVQAWLDHEPLLDRRSTVVRSAWLAPALAIFALWPLAAGSRAVLYLDFLVGVVVGVPVLLAIARGRRWLAPVLPVLVAGELIAAGLIGPISPGSEASVFSVAGPPERFSRSFLTLHRPDIDAREYVTPGPIGMALVSARSAYGRYFSLDPSIALTRASGFLRFQTPAYWPAYENGRSILFGIDEIQGYSPIQLDRYWRLVRRAATAPVFYNQATFQSLRPEVLRLFGVEWVIMRATDPSPPGATPAAQEGNYTLYRLPDPEPRASVVFDWDMVPPERGLDVVLRSGFDPAIRAIVETDPSLATRSFTPPRSGTGNAEYTEVRPEHVVVEVTSSAPGLLVIRNVFDRNWRATVDGRPAPVLITDYLLQGVALPAGSHTVELTYRDQAVGLGLLLSAAAWSILLAMVGWFALRDRRRRRDTRSAGSGRPAEPLSASHSSAP